MASSNLDQTLRELQASSYALPDTSGGELHCDLVMKGGITSGVVYPMAVLNLARRYRFHSIGGTSAGAIAAAVTAAAEYGRERGGFNRLVDVVRELQSPGFLANVFQPAPRTRPVLQLLFLALDFKRHTKRQTDDIPTRLRLTGSVFRLLGALTFAPPSKAGIIGGLLGAALAALGASGWIVAGVAGNSWQLLWGVLLIVVFAWLCGMIGTLGHILQGELPANYFGVCGGRPVADHARNRLVRASVPQSPALTDWLSNTIDALAGMPAGQPLTFGKLRAKPANQAGTDWGIRLNTVTTNISQGQPYVMPFTDRQFLFSEEECRDLFPPHVVDHMVQHAYRPADFAMPATITDKRGRTHTLRFLPASDDLPVILGVRMSLSFPVLLSAVPLWTISRETFRAPEFRDRAPGSLFALTFQNVRRNWFSDGGICSNFPIHFYDQILPPYPTFGINLGQQTIDDQSGQLAGLDFQWEESTQSDADPALRAYSTTPDAHVPASSISLPSSYPRDRPGPLWEALDGTLPGFIGAIVNTGLFYRDIVQSRLPSYYDRIVTIYLNDREGGINLDMPTTTISKIAGKGYEAADAILKTFNFDHHLWVRMRLLLGKLEQGMIELHDPLFTQKPQVDMARLNALVGEITKFLTDSGVAHTTVQQLLDAQQAAYDDKDTRYPYARDTEWLHAVLPQLYVFLLMIQQWGGADQARLQLGQPHESLAELRQREDHIRLRVTPEL